MSRYRIVPTLGRDSIYYRVEKSSTNSFFFIKLKTDWYYYGTFCTIKEAKEHIIKKLKLDKDILKEKITYHD